MKVTTRNVSPLSLRAEFTPGSVNAEKRTVEVVWTTGASVLRSSWYDGPFYEELSLDPTHVRMGRLNNGAPFLANHEGHRLGSVLGVVESAKLEGNRGTAVVRFAKAEDDPEADKVFRKIQDGIIQNISVGYRVYKTEKIEGVENKIPTLRAVDWEPYEISAVPMGADDGAGFRSASETNSCVFVTPGESRMDEIELEAKRQADLKAAADAAAKAERERAASIRAQVRAVKLDDSVADKLINDAASLEDARTVILNEVAKRTESVQIDNHVRFEVVETAQDKMNRGAAAWLFEKAGQTKLIQRASERGIYGSAKVDLDGAEFRGMTLVDLARAYLNRAGVSVKGMDKMQIVGRALTFRSGPYASISDFAVLFENVMHKLLLGAYSTTPDTWSRFCGTKEVSDFRAHNFFRTGSFGSLDSLVEGQEYSRKSIPDGQKTSVTVGTVGNIIALSRQAIINDDMGALSDLSMKLGRGAALSIEKEVYRQLLLNSGLGPTQSDSQPFFHANRANVNTSATAITAAGIDADRVVMASQMDISSNDYLDLRPKVLLVPIGKASDAKTLNDAQYDPVDNKFQRPNHVRGLFSDIVDTPRLTGTRRYLFTDPAIAPAIVVTFLEGSGRAPVMESQEGWNVDGTEWKVRLDMSVTFFDGKGAVTNAGA